MKTRGLGEVLYAPLDVILANTTIVQPDLIFIAPAHASRVSRRGIEGAPTLAVEILSPSTTTIDRSRKLQLYARHGVPYYWIVDPEARTLEGYELADGVYRLVGRAAGTASVSLRAVPRPHARSRLALAVADQSCSHPKFGVGGGSGGRSQLPVASGRTSGSTRTSSTVGWFEAMAASS